MQRTRVKGGEKKKEDDRLFVRIVVTMETDRTKTDGREGKMKKVAMVVFTVLLGLCLAGNVLAESATKDECIAKTKEAAKSKYLFKEFTETAKSKGEGWVGYMWANPGDPKPRKKISYIFRVPGKNVYTAAGIWE